MPVTPTINHYAGGGDGSVMTLTWLLTTANPTGIAMSSPEHADRTWTVFGTSTPATFGGATCSIEGANVDTEVVFTTLSEPDQTTALTFAAIGTKTALELPLFMRPKLTTVGSGAALTVICVARRQNNMRT